MKVLGTSREGGWLLASVATVLFLVLVTATRDVLDPAAWPELSLPFLLALGAFIRAMTGKA